jgi:tripartite-type tricarboxylate transporter receptor subunit TctC
MELFGQSQATKIVAVIVAPVLSAWVGIGAPKNTATEIIDKLNSEINVALADPKIIARVVEQSASPFPTSRAEFAKFVVEFTDKWARIIKTANIKAE